LLPSTERTAGELRRSSRATLDDIDRLLASLAI
jgi:hypothetical protein